jgi:GxxExxY protein
LKERIPYDRERRFTLKYKDQVLRDPYLADFIAFDPIVIKVKSVSSIIDTDLAQALSYITVPGKKLAIVINFEKGHRPGKELFSNSCDSLKSV